MALKLYNTLTRKLEVFRPLKNKKVGLYTCGPTVYDEAHIGNLRSYIFADVLRRTIELNGFKVRWVMNITDVDDKTIKRTVDKYGSKATPKDLLRYTTEYIKKFKKDLAEINIPAERIEFIRISDKIKEIKNFIKELIKLGYAYKTEDGVYFNIEKYQKKFGDYGVLVGPRFLEGKKVGARVKVDEYEKDDLSDFALWKKHEASDGNIFWPDPKLGNGRPGWHIECSVVNREAFGDRPTDIHTGGVDLIFPHHTNEIAQSQPFYKPFVRHWAHCEHLLVNNKKMAKREGNFYTLQDIKKLAHPLAFRYLVLQSHYRSKLNFTKQSLQAAESGLKSLSKDRFSKSNLGRPDKTYEKVFLEDLNSDLNTSGALGTLRHFTRYKGTGSRADKMAEALGLKFFKPKAIKIPLKVKKLAQKREQFRKSKQFMQADRLRREINRLGYTVDDTSAGPAIRPND